MEADSQKIIFRTIIEVLGKPEDHVNKALLGFVEQIEKDDKYILRAKEVAEIKKQEQQELWAGFAELEVQVTSVLHIVQFCFQYMPSIIEVLEPEELTFKDADLSILLSDLQARLHNVDMVAKQLKVENNELKRNTSALLRNYVTILLKKGKLSIEQLSKYTGVDNQEKLADFLDTLIDAGRLDLKDGLYFLKDGTK